MNNEHDWAMHTYRGLPAFKCRTCGFVWKPDMFRPKVTCEQIIAQNEQTKEVVENG